jgi:hypothetical protein
MDVNNEGFFEQPKQEQGSTTCDKPVAHIGKTQFERLKDCGLVTTSLTSHKAFEDDIALYTTPQRGEK